jgi:putative aldouronate transport system substrate-binding protein
VLNGNYDAYWLDQIINKQFAAANPDIKDPMEAVKLMAPLKLDASSKPAWPAQNYEYEIFANKAVDDEKLERLIEIYDWFLSDEGKVYYNYGFENKDYKMENGKYVSLLPKDAKGITTPLVNVYKSANIKSFFTWAWDENVDPKWNTTNTDKIVKLDADVKAMYNPATISENVLAIIANVPAKESCSATMSNVESDFQTLVTSNNIEKDFAAFKTKTLESQGMQDVIEEVTKYMKDKGFDK